MRCPRHLAGSWFSSLAVALGTAASVHSGCAPPTACAGTECFVVVRDGSSGFPRDSGSLDDPTSEGRREVCGNGADEDGDNQPDNGCTCAPGLAQACYVGPQREADVGVCHRGEQVCVANGEFGMWGPCQGQGYPYNEICDGLDNDCDGSADEDGCACAAEETCGDGLDNDCDGLVDDGCVCTPRPEVCGNGLDDDCNGVADNGCDCTPSSEVCGDGLDNDCNGAADDGCACTPGDSRSCYAGPAATAGVGVCRAGAMRCESPAGGGSRWTGCVGQVLPAASEICDDGLDNNCNGIGDCSESTCTGSSACCHPLDQTIDVVLTPADVLLVVDSSGSMGDRMGSGTRWQALQSATAAVLPAVQDVLYLGLLTYPTVGWFDSCRVQSAPEIGVALNNAGAINSQLGAHGPFGGTPTEAAVNTARSYLVSHRSSRPQFLLLATDGEPNCGGGAAGVVTVLSSMRTVDGIPTFVLGVAASGEWGLNAALNSMAEAGGRPRSGTTKYYSVDSADTFARALRGISAATTGCRYALSAAPYTPSALTVQQDTTPVSRDGANGWEYTDASNTQIQFNGTSCERLTDGLVSRIVVHQGC